MYEWTLFISVIIWVLNFWEEKGNMLFVDKTHQYEKETLNYWKEERSSRKAEEIEEVGHSFMPHNLFIVLLMES